MKYHKEFLHAVNLEFTTQFDEKAYSGLVPQSTDDFDEVEEYILRTPLRITESNLRLTVVWRDYAKICAAILVEDYSQWIDSWARKGKQIWLHHSHEILMNENASLFWLSYDKFD